MLLRLLLSNMWKGCSNMPQPFRFDWKMLEKNYFLIVYMAFLSARRARIVRSLASSRELIGRQFSSKPLRVIP